MEFDVPMPKIGELMEEGELVEWLVEVGDHVDERDPIAIVATDKVEVEIESPFSGVVSALAVEPEETVAVGETICVVIRK